MFGDDPIEQIRLPVKELDAEDRRAWSGAARSDQLVELLEIAERLQAEIVRSVGESDTHTDWALDGALSPRTWFTHRAPISAVGAHPPHEATGDALRPPDATGGHVGAASLVGAYARNADAVGAASRCERLTWRRQWRG